MTALSNTNMAERPNKVEIIDVEPTRKKFKIEIPAETVAETLGVSFDTLMNEVEMPGFRKGHVPRRLVEKRFGSVAKGQAKDQLVAAAVGRAIEESKLRVLGEPTSQTLGNVELEAGKALAFEVDVEVLPLFDLPTLDGMAVRKPKFEVSEEMVGKEVEKLAVQEGTLEERPVPEGGDYITGHARMEGSNGKVYFESAGIVVQVPTADKGGKGMIVGIAIDDFAKQLGTPKAGDTVVIKTKGPQTHENEELRGLDLTITYKPARADRIIAAKVEDLAARFGMEGEPQLKDAIRERLEQRVLVDQQAVMRQQIAKQLLESVKMELPQRVTAVQAGRNLERRRLEMLYRGMDPQKIEERLAEMRSHSMGDATRELKIFFILDKAAESLDVRVSEQEVNGRIAQIAMERNMRPEQLRQQMIQQGQVSSVFSQIREHKTMDAILAKAKVEEVSIEDFNAWAKKEREESMLLGG
ncbi:MAG: trigger factor [Phycisphaerales bacterium]